MAVFRVERNTGYTVMSNHHLRNKELSLKAKGLLSQMLSLPEDWDYTLAGLSYINRESIDAIRTAVWELEKAGYITKQEGHQKGDKLDPDKTETITFTVTAKPTMKLENIVGRKVEDVTKELGEKGFVVVSSPLSTSELSEEELKTIKYDVVISCDPAEGTQYTQEGEAYIMLYYYQP